MTNVLASKAFQVALRIPSIVRSSQGNFIYPENFRVLKIVNLRKCKIQHIIAFQISSRNICVICILLDCPPDVKMNFLHWAVGVKSIKSKIYYTIWLVLVFCLNFSCFS